jgi:hypothetical protein
MVNGILAGIGIVVDNIPVKRRYSIKSKLGQRTAPLGQNNSSNSREFAGQKAMPKRA